MYSLNYSLSWSLFVIKPFFAPIPAVPSPSRTWGAQAHACPTISTNSIHPVSGTRSHPLDKPYAQSFLIWNLLTSSSQPPTSIEYLFHISFILEEHLQNVASLCSALKPTPDQVHGYSTYDALTDFYCRPEVHPKSYKRSTYSLFHQLNFLTDTQIPKTPQNQFSALYSPDNEMTVSTMDIEHNETYESSSGSKDPSSIDHTWGTDSKVSALSMAIFAHLSDKQRQAKDAGDLDSSAQQYSQPVHSIKPTTSPNQHI